MHPLPLLPSIFPSLLSKLQFSPTQQATPVLPPGNVTHTRTCKYARTHTHTHRQYTHMRADKHKIVCYPWRQHWKTQFDLVTLVLLTCALCDASTVAVQVSQNSDDFLNLVTHSTPNYTKYRRKCIKILQSRKLNYIGPPCCHFMQCPFHRVAHLWKYL